MSENFSSGTQIPKQTENKHWYFLWQVMIVLEIKIFKYSEYIFALSLSFQLRKSVWKNTLILDTKDE